MGRLLIPLIFGVFGCAFLASLGMWQLQRLTWKEGMLAEIEARIYDAPVALPAELVPEQDRYLPVRVAGRTLGREVDVLVSTKEQGAGFRVISAFETESGRLIMVDEGFVRQTEKDAMRPGVQMVVIGNVHWPDEIDGFTPAADLDAEIWFARDVPTMAAHLGTEPVLVIARTITGTDARATPLPVSTEGIPNSHLGYAVQWFGLALVWAGMTAFFVWRMQRRQE
ncbi:MAG: SURF1 family protein [Silicimonas sp.]|nr:SURF1 family protein [Silicimonas sp.]